jgi:hypothetical protein
MPRPRSKNTVTAAITSILKPALLPLGFGPIGGRGFGRINDCILHYIGVTVTAWSSPDFWIEYALLTLVQPHDHIYLTWGDRLRNNGRGYRWQAYWHEDADHSMINVVAALGRLAFPFFDAHGSPQTMIQLVRSDLGVEHHKHFELGALQAWLNETNDAKRSLQQAARLYDEDYNESLQMGLDRSWTMDYKRQVEVLMAAMDAGEHRELQLRWFDTASINFGSTKSPATEMPDVGLTDFPRAPTATAPPPTRIASTAASTASA